MCLLYIHCIKYRRFRVKSTHMYIRTPLTTSCCYILYIHIYIPKLMHTNMNNRNTLRPTAYSEESTNRKIYIHVKVHTYILPTHTSM